jgi:hypothetical protein
MITKVFSNSSETTHHQEVVNDLLKELSLVRSEVYVEYLYLKEVSNRRRGRLLSLFIKDLSQGVSGSVLSSKASRDQSKSRSLSRKLDGVSPFVKCLGWIFVFLMNMGMLFYVYLFAINQTHSRQSAWFQSFVFWLIFEVFVSSTGLVLFVHLLIPLLVLTDISRVKEKVLSDLISYRQSYLSDQRSSSGGGGGNEKCEESQQRSFNSAKYLFPSWRVASLCPELPESGFILKFSTPWPKKKFGNAQGEVANEYDQAVILTALSRVLIFFLTPFLHFHVLLQDIIVQTFCTSGFGYLVVWSVQLSAIHPLLPVVPVLVVVLCLCLLLRWSSGDGMDLKKFEMVHPKKEIKSFSEHNTVPGDGQPIAIDADHLERGEPDQQSGIHEEPVVSVVDHSDQSNQASVRAPSPASAEVAEEDSSHAGPCMWKEYLPGEDELLELESGHHSEGEEEGESELQSPEEVSSSSSEELTFFIRYIPARL